MKQQDLNWFEPLWRRLIVLAICAVWCGLEFWRGDQVWGVCAAAVSAYAIWTFFITFDSKLAKGKDDGQQPPPAS